MQTWKVVKKQKNKNNQQKPWGRRIAALLLVLATIGTFFYNFPNQWNKLVKTVNPSLLVEETDFRLGLDLQGGTHLVYEADMASINEDDRVDALEGVKDVIERRVNAFGVSEPVVQTTTTGGTYRVIIELAGINNVTDAINQIGETPVLEFKKPGQQLERDPTDEEKLELENLNLAETEAAKDVLKRALAGENFDELLNEFSIEPERENRGVINDVTEEGYFGEFAKAIKTKFLTQGRVYSDIVETKDGINIFRYDSKGSRTDTLLSHILICFEGKTNCSDPIPEIEASVKINEIKEKATSDNFADLAKENSVGPTSTNGGDLGWSNPSSFVDAFKLKALSIGVGDISDVVETEFGYHIIHKRDERPVDTYNIKRIVLKKSTIFDVVPQSSPWTNTDLSGKHLDRASVEFDYNTGAPFVTLKFNSQGGDLFAEITSTHIGKPIAIFLDGSPISTPTVQQAIYGGSAVITGDFTVEEAKLLAQRLNAGALPVAVNLLSQQTVGPTLGSISLEKSINAALMGFALVALFMVAMYRLPGLIAVITLLLFALMNLAAYRIFGVTITLAGIAGFVLSLGIAVDANVLIIERLKEELKSGRGFISAADEAFNRAWTAIRDGNITTLIAAGVLYWFSSSFIRGFALTLSIGVVLSMFTAITVTQVYIKTILEIKASRNEFLFGVKKEKE